MDTHSIFTAQHEANLATWIGGNGAVGVIHYWEEGLAKGLHLFNKLQMQPLTLSCECYRNNEKPGWSFLLL